MNIIYYLCSILMLGGIFLFLHFAKNKPLIPKFDNAKTVALLYGALFFVRLMGGHYKLQETLGLNVNSPFGPRGALLALLCGLLIWLIYALQLLLVTYPFFHKDIPLVTPLVRFAAPCVYGVALVALPWLNRAMDGDLADAFHWRNLILALEIGVGFALSLHYLLHQKPSPLTKTQWGKTVLILVGMLFINLPCWLPQLLFGDGGTEIVIDGFNLWHRLVLYGSLLFVFPVHFLFHKYEYQIKRYALLYISMATMISYCYKYDFSTFLDLPSWPLHLCNTAMFIIPLVLIFRWEKLYYFTLFINVLGAFLAMILPNIDGVAWLSARSIEFWLNHYMAMLLPILVMSLKIFPRPKLKQFLYSLIAFFAYYVTILLANCYLTGIGHNVDFFFINSDFIASKLGEWAENIRDITFTFTSGGHTFVLYPVYQSLYFVVYIILSFAMWFLYEQVFEVTDIYAIISERNRKVKADQLALEAHLAGRSMQEPMNPQNEGKLILRHFSKRYSTSDVYAVYDANLEIDGGQIFGFLGPNGAGKSTIIKSIVGIQTISGGEIEISGYDVEKQAVGAKMQIGFVPDHYALYENLTGREYINYIADLYSVSKEDRDARIDEYVARFRLEKAIDNPMKTYSHGMKQKITIMSALVHNPKVWILDEPLTGLDPESIFQVKECMKEHAKRGNIVFFSSHIIDVVENICDRIAIIRKGRILCTKSIEEIEASGIKLEDFYMSTIDGNTQDAIPVSTPLPQMQGATV